MRDPVQVARLLLLTLTTATLASAAPPHEVIVDSTDLADINPSASISGELVAVERALFGEDPLEICAVILSTDVVLYEPRAACGSRVVRMLTHDGRSVDPAVSADASKVAWRTRDASGAGWRVVVANVDGSAVTELFNCPGGDVDSVDVAPLGTHVAFRAYNCAGSGQQQIIRVAVASPGIPDVIDSMPFQEDLGLNRHRTMTAGGAVYYSRRVGSAHDLFKSLGGGSPPIALLQPSTLEDERNISADRLDGGARLFRRTSLTGVDNLFALVDTGTQVQLTANTQASWRIGDATIADGGFIYEFESNGNFEYDNTDLSQEIFVGVFSWAGPQSIFQVTNMSDPASIHVIRGSDIVDAGDVSAYNYRGYSVLASDMAVPLASPCHHGLLNRLPLTLYPTRYESESAPTEQRFIDNVVPSFEAALDSPLATDAICWTIPPLHADAECAVVVLNPSDVSRHLRVHALWIDDTCHDQDQPPLLLDVAAGARSTFTVHCNSGCYDPFVGSVQIDIVSPDAGQPDVSQHLTWTFPP